MKHPNHFGRWLACVLLCLLLAGCSMPGEQVQVEELLRAPKLSGDYGDVQTALNDWLGESAQLKYPMQGDLLSPFLLQDLDGDGRQDAAVLYTTAQSSNVCIAILQKDDADIWHVRQNVEGLADTVESVGLAQLQPGDATQLVVGYTAAQGDHYLAVYSYTDGVLSTILEQQYQQYLVEDITGGGNQDLILMSTLEDGGVQIELLTGAGPAFPATIWPACCCVLTRTRSRWCLPIRSAPKSFTPHPCAMCPVWSVRIWTATASWRSPPSRTKRAC